MRFPPTPLSISTSAPVSHSGSGTVKQATGSMVGQVSSGLTGGPLLLHPGCCPIPSFGAALRVTGLHDSKHAGRLGVRRWCRRRAHRKACAQPEVCDSVYLGGVGTVTHGHVLKLATYSARICAESPCFWYLFSSCENGPYAFGSGNEPLSGHQELRERWRSEEVISGNFGHKTCWSFEPFNLSR